MVNKGSLQDYDIAVATDVDISAKCAATSFDKRIIVSASHSSICRLSAHRCGIGTFLLFLHEAASPMQLALNDLCSCS